MPDFLSALAAVLLLYVVGRGIWGDIKFHRTYGWDVFKRQAPKPDDQAGEKDRSCKERMES